MLDYDGKITATIQLLTKVTEITKKKVLTSTYFGIGGWNFEQKSFKTYS